MPKCKERQTIKVKIWLKCSNLFRAITSLRMFPRKQHLVLKVNFVLSKACCGNFPVAWRANEFFKMILKKNWHSADYLFLLLLIDLQAVLGRLPVLGRTLQGCSCHSSALGYTQSLQFSPVIQTLCPKSLPREYDSYVSLLCLFRNTF